MYFRKYGTLIRYILLYGITDIIIMVGDLHVHT